MNRYVKVLSVVFLAVLLTVLVAPLVQAGPPPPELVKKLDKKGGDEDGGGAGGAGGAGTGNAGQDESLDWSGYDEAPVPMLSPAGQGINDGTQQDWGQLWPPNIGDPLAWLGQQLNPGKWIVDSLQGGIVVLGKGFLTTETWIVLFFLGQGPAVVEAYDAKMSWDGSSGPPPEGEPLEVPTFRDLDPESWDGSGDYVGRNVLVFTPSQMTWKNELVENLWRTIVMVSAVLLMGVMAYGGFRVMLGGGAPGQMSAGDFLARALGAGILTVVTLPLFGLAIKISNLFSVVVAPQSNDVLMFTETINAAQSVPAVLEGIIAMSTFMFVMIVVIGIMLLRLGLLCFAIVTAPIALLTWIFPGSRQWWERWSRLAVGALILQPVLMLVLRLGMFLMQLPISLTGMQPEAMRAMLEGGPQAEGWPHFLVLIAEPLIGIVMMILCVTLTGMLLGGGNIMGSMTGGGQNALNPGMLVTHLLGGGKKEAAERAAAQVAAAPSSTRSPAAAVPAVEGELATASMGAGYWSAASVGGQEVGTGSAVAGGQLSTSPPQMPRSAVAQTAPVSRQELGTEVVAIGTDTATMTASGMPWQAAAGLAAAQRAETIGPALGLDDNTARQIGTTARSGASVMPSAGGAGPATGGAGSLSSAGPSVAAAVPAPPAGPVAASAPPPAVPAPPAGPVAAGLPSAAVPPAPRPPVVEREPPSAAPATAAAPAPPLASAEQPPAEAPLSAAPRRRRRTKPASAEDASPAEAPEKGE